MRDVHIMVEVELMRSDGNYGRDRAVCQLSATLDANDDPEAELGALMDQVSAEAEGRLGRSPSLEVRRTMLRKARLCAECQEPLADDEDYRHEACEQQVLERRAKERAERDAEYQRQREARELAGVGATTLQLPDDQDDDDEDDDEDEPL